MRRQHLCAMAPLLWLLVGPGLQAVPAWGASSYKDEAMALRAADEAEEYLVGIYYFAGWWAEQPNKYTVAGRDWREDYPERVPTLGEYNEQATMDREIVTAAEYGVDFFQILWYPVQVLADDDPHRVHLNSAVGQFMASPHCGRLRFTVEYVNHSPFEIKGDDEWEAACREWTQAMRHPSYLRVDGRPVFKVHSLELFHTQNGRDADRVQARLETLRHIAQADGAGDPWIGAGAFSTGPLTASYDFLSHYMLVPDLPVREEPYPYADLLHLAEQTWSHYAATGDKPYLPYLPAGWDPRPWRDPRPSFQFPDAEAWAAALRSVKTALDRQPRLGLPTRNSRQKAFLIYAWNEFGEGGIVAPTHGEGLMKLTTIREIFGNPHRESRATAE